MLNAAVTQATISATICVAGYTAAIRQPTTALKKAQIASYRYVDHAPAGYEEDHLVPLELGGSATSRANLFPEPLAVAGVDDAMESRLRDEVCTEGRSSLPPRRQSSR